MVQGFFRLGSRLPWRRGCDHSAFGLRSQGSDSARIGERQRAIVQFDLPGRIKLDHAHRGHGVSPLVRQDHRRHVIQQSVSGGKLRVNRPVSVYAKLAERHDQVSRVGAYLRNEKRIARGKRRPGAFCPHGLSFAYLLKPGKSDSTTMFPPPATIDAENLSEVSRLPVVFNRIFFPGILLTSNCSGPA